MYLSITKNKANIQTPSDYATLRKGSDYAYDNSHCKFAQRIRLTLGVEVVSEFRLGLCFYLGLELGFYLGLGLDLALDLWLWFEIY